MVSRDTIGAFNGGTIQPLCPWCPEIGVNPSPLAKGAFLFHKSLFLGEGSDGTSEQKNVLHPSNRHVVLIISIDLSS